MTKFNTMLILTLASVTSGAQVTTNFSALDRIATEVRIKEAADRREAEGLARLLGLQMRQLCPDGTVMELMAFEQGRPVYFRTTNVNAAKTISADKVHPGGVSGYNLTGSGVTLGIWDGGTVRNTHQEFGGRVTRRDAEPLNGHATHCAGTLGAAGVSPNAKGMSIQALIHSWGWTNDGSEMAAAAADGLRISNHSYNTSAGWSWDGTEWTWWGNPFVDPNEDAQFGWYSLRAKVWDDVAYNAPYYLICHGAGNDRNEAPASQPVMHKEWGGPGVGWIDSWTVRPPDGGATGFDSVLNTVTSKNILTVAAVDDVTNYTGPSSVTMSSFSGWGPTDDGRIKPDISANGISLYSSSAVNDAAYNFGTGTSMSGPNAAGGLGLLVQHYRLLNAGADMRSASLKALALHTAKEAGPNPGPDYMFGWGLLDVDAGAKVILDSANKLALIKEDTLNQTQKNEITIVSNGTGPLKVTLCWTDPAPAQGDLLPPGSLDNPKKMLINDLDLRVKTGAVTHLPWILDPANPASAATKGDNERDNVEQVVVDNTSVGQAFTIEVGHKGVALAPSGQQAYSVIVTGGQIPAPKVLKKLTLTPNNVVGGNGVTGSVELEAPAGAGGQFVELGDNSTAIGTPAGVTVPEGSSSISFNVTTQAVGAVYVRQVWGKVNTEQVTANLTLRPPMLLKAFSANPTTVYGGQTSTGTLTLNQPALPGGISVNVTSASSVIQVPATVVVPEGASSQTFAIQTLDVTSTVTRVVTASYGGTVKNVGITIQPAIKLTTFKADPSTIEGGNSVLGILGLNIAAPAGGATVDIVSNSVMFQVPPQVTIPQGQTGATFTINVAASSQTVTRTVSASYGGVTRTVAITILTTTKLVSFTANPMTVVGGQSTTGTLTLSAPAPPGGSVVNLSSASTVIVVPGTVTIPAGQTAINFTIGTKAVSQTVVRPVTATKAGVTKTINLTLTPP